MVEVLDAGSVPGKDYSTFTISRIFSSGITDEQVMGEMVKYLGGLTVLSEGISREKDGRARYEARVRSEGNGGIPSFNGIMLGKVFIDGAIPYFDGVRLYKVSEKGGVEEYTFIKWVRGELKFTKVSPGITFTEDMWDAVCMDFKKTERMMEARGK